VQISKKINRSTKQHSCAIASARAVETPRPTLTFSVDVYIAALRCARVQIAPLLLSRYCLVSLSAHTYPLNCGKIAAAYRALRAPATETPSSDRCYKVARALTIAAIYCLTPAR